MPENAINLTQYDPWKDTPILGNEPLDLDEYDPWSDTPISEPVQALDLNEYDPWQDIPIEDRYTTYNDLMGKDGYVAQAVDRGEISIGKEGDDRPGHFWQGLGAFISQFPSIATDVIPTTVYRAARRGEDVTLEDETSIDRLIRKNIQERAKYKTLSEEERQKKWFRVNIPFTNIGIDINLAQAEDVADSLGYSVVNAFATLLGRAVGRGVGAVTGPAAPVAAPVLGVAAGFASGYYVASGATRDEFVERARDAYLKEVGGKVNAETEAGWQARYEMIKSDADWTGFWEAAPETVGNLLMFGIAKLPIKGAVAKIGLAGAVNKLKNEAVREIGKELINKVGIPVAKLMGMLTEETFTEALTTMKQSEIEYKNGMRDKPLSYLESIVEVLPTVLLTTPILGLGMGGAVKILEKTTGKVVEEKDKKKLTEIFDKMVTELPREEVIVIRDRMLVENPDHPAIAMIDKALERAPKEAPKPEGVSPEAEVLERGRVARKESVIKTLEVADQEAVRALGREHGLTDAEMDDRSIDEVIRIVADRVVGITAPAVEGQGGGIDVLETIVSGIDKTFKAGTVTEAPADATRTQAQKLMGAMGGQLTFFEETGKSILSTLNGFHDPKSKRIFINAKAKNPALRVLGHEAWHRLKTKHSDLYENVKAVAEANEEVFIDFMIKLNGRRKTIGLKSLKIDNLTEEYLADFAGEMFVKASFWKAINESNPTFARKIANSLRKIIQDFRRIIAAKPELKKIKQPFENMDQVEAAMSEAFGKAFMREAAPKEAKMELMGYHGSPKAGLTMLQEGIGTEYQRVAGIYITKTKKNALKYTKIKGKTQPENIYKLKIDIKNPANRKVLDEIGYKLDGKEMRKELIRRGYDGVIDDFMDEIIVFNSKQIEIIPKTKPVEAKKRPVEKAKREPVKGVKLDIKAPEFKTGQKVTFQYLRNLERAPDMGARFGQDIEPAGRYIIHNETGDTYLADKFPDKYEIGEITFENPLIIKIKDPLDHKTILYEKYKKKGESLSRAIAKDGYDGIISMYPDGSTGEIIDISKYAKLAPEKAKEEPEIYEDQLQKFKETEFKDSDEIMSFIGSNFHDKVGVIKGKKPEEPKLEIQAYHGTGTVFEEFDTGYIGTGEGATAFGWGLYFSSIENIGKHYAEQIGKIGSLYDNFSLFGKKLAEYALADIEDYMSVFRIYVDSPTSENLKMIRDNAQADLSLYKDQKRMGDESIYHDRMEIVDRKIDFYGKLSKVKESDIKFPKRQLYKVTLHKGKKPGDYAWLDWYEPISLKQMEKMRKQWDKEFPDKLFPLGGRPLSQDIYRALGQNYIDAQSQKIQSINKKLGAIAKQLDKYRKPGGTYEDPKGIALKAEYDSLMSEKLLKYTEVNPQKQTSLFLLQAGIDGISYPTETLSGKLGKGFNYVVFDADAISIEDRVSFSLKGPELSPIGKQYMDAFLGKQGEEAPVARSRIRGLLYPWKYVTGKSLASGETIGEILIRKTQNKFIHLKKLQKRLSPTTQLEDKIDVYLSEEVLSGRTTWQLDRFENNYVKPFLDKMLEVGIDIKDLDLYVYAAHAPERNARIDKKNPDFREKGIPGSGMHTGVANTIIKKYKEKGMLGKLEGLAKILYKINTARVKLLLSAGLITKETHDTVLGTYKRYVPLRGKEGEPDFMGSGRGFSTPSTGLQRALGRKSFAQSPLAWSLGAVEETIVKINKNEVGKSLLGLIREYPDKDLWTIDEVTTKQKWDPEKGEVETVRVPAWAQKDVLHVWEDGKRRNVKIKNPLLERALLNIGSEKMNAITAALAKFNRYLAMINTSLSPRFVLTNFIRDFQMAGIKLSADQSLKLAAKVARDVPKALRHAYRGYRGKPGIGDWGKWFKLYRSSGGSIGFFGLRGVEDKVKTIDAMIKRTRKGVLPSARRGISELGGFISDVNSAVENAVRLASFKNAVEFGLTPVRAASLSKNLTVNFNRKGELGALMNSFYLFYNAGMQGTANVLKLMTTKRGQIIGAGVAATAFMMTELNRMAGGDDEDDGRNYYDKIPNYVKERHIVFMIPDTEGKYIKFPLPYGFNVFWVIGEQTNSALHSGKPVQGAINVLNAVVDAFNPMGGDSTLIRTLSPTLADIPLDLYMNQNFAGYPIKPEQSQFGLPKPQSWLYWRSVSPISKYIAQKVNKLTKGNPIRPGKIDVSPEVLDYLVGTFTGAMGTFANRSLNLGIDLLTGEKTALHKTPFRGALMGEQTEFYTGSEYRKVTEEIKRRIEEKKEGLPAVVPELSSELKSRYKATEKTLRSSRKRIKDIERSQLSAKRKRELVKKKRDEMSFRQKDLIKRFDREIGGNPWEMIDVLNLRKARKKVNG